MGMTRTTSWPLAALVLALGACSSETPFEVIEEVAFDASLGIDLTRMTRLPSGVYIEDLVVGSGAVIAPGDHVSVRLTAWLSNGAQWSDGLLTFDYRVTNLGVEGLYIGLEGIALGGTRRIIVPPELAYGEFPPPESIIPKGAILIYEVDLVAIA